MHRTAPAKAFCSAMSGLSLSGPAGRSSMRRFSSTTTAARSCGCLEAGGLKVTKHSRILVGFLLVLFPVTAWAGGLPGEYYRVLNQALERQKDSIPGKSVREPPPPDIWTRYPGFLLAAAVLYSQDRPENPYHGEPRLLHASEILGDILVVVSEEDKYLTPLNSRWLVYDWLDSYRLLEDKLKPERRARWKDGLIRIVTLMAQDVERLQDYPRYQAPFITTSTNHFALWSSTVHLAGIVFDRPDWESLGVKVMHRLATSDQAPDGFWGEHSDAGPTVGYDYLTLSAVALYAEHSDDPDAKEALRRSTTFHLSTTYPNGKPVDVINGRNRDSTASFWGHFGFSHFPEGRRYAEFLLGYFPEASLGKTSLGRMAQNALYYHDGPAAPMPLDLPDFEYRMKVPAGTRKTGPWYVCLSGLIEAQAPRNTFFLDRQSHLSVFHEKTGLIITGAGSKHQPELATFTESFDGTLYHIPISSDLLMSKKDDRLALAYSTFFSELHVAPPKEKELRFRFDIVRTQGRSKDTRLTLQLALRPGEILKTAGGECIELGSENIDLSPTQIGGAIRHGSWELSTNSKAHLLWPVYPHDPYTNSPETELGKAVGALVMPFDLDEFTIPYEKKAIEFQLKVNADD